LAITANIGQNVFIATNVKLGNNVKVQNNVSIYEGVVCEDDVFLGPSMVFTNIINPRSAVSRKNAYKQTLIRKGASVGANATIICGNDIGEYAFHRGRCSCYKSGFLSYGISGW
jgi:UDP-2-acetamido-3-amino-2,3-dideoxy-glucuronate N-acetyltransferase